jgi:hypothetical protein
MSYSTMLYAVDIGALKSAYGSKDNALLTRVRAAIQEGQGTNRPVDPAKGPRVKITWQSEIYFNGRPVTRDEFKEQLFRPEWAGMYLNLYQETDAPPGQKREGEFKVLGSFAAFLYPLLKYEVSETGEVKRHIIGVNWCSTEKDLGALGEPQDDITEDQALEELIAGKITQPRNASTYGYALENLCQAMGKFLDAVGTDRLRSLKLKTPLSKTRSPVKLPKSEDFPYISFLDEQELRDEVARLRTVDLADPNDPENEEERKYFLQLLEQAVALNCGIVGFYH